MVTEATHKELPHQVARLHGSLAGLLAAAEAAGFEGPAVENARQTVQAVNAYVARAAAEDAAGRVK